MRKRLILLFAVASGPLFAGDLACLPPYVDLGESVPIIGKYSKWVSVTGGETKEKCVPAEASKVLKGSHCYVNWANAQRQFAYSCNLGQNCGGQGTFMRVYSKPGAPGLVENCFVVHGNDHAVSATVDFRY